MSAGRRGRVRDMGGVSGCEGKGVRVSVGGERAERASREEEARGRVGREFGGCDLVSPNSSPIAFLTKFRKEKPGGGLVRDFRGCDLAGRPCVLELNGC
jgi:hypothetical protein